MRHSTPRQLHFTFQANAYQETFLSGLVSPNETSLVVSQNVSQSGFRVISSNDARNELQIVAPKLGNSPPESGECPILAVRGRFAINLPNVYRKVAKTIVYLLLSEARRYTVPDFTDGGSYGWLPGGG
jgi:hypothetical protein